MQLPQVAHVLSHTRGLAGPEFQQSSALKLKILPPNLKQPVYYVSVPTLMQIAAQSRS